jgi:MFS transporter, PPP family, 3-phenylpropionic acid transporter
MATDDHSLLRVRALFCLIGFAEAAFVPFLPLLLRDRGLDPQAIGAVLALLAAVGFAAGPLWGYLADSVLGRERTFALCLAGTVGGSLLLGFSRGTIALAIAGSVTWLFRAPAMPLADALALDRLGPSRRDRYGTVRFWMSATFAIGALIWGIVIEAYGINVMAFGYACLVGVNAVLVALVFRGRWPRPLALAPQERRLGSLASTPPVLLFLIALFLIFTPYSAAYSFAAVQIAALGGGALFVGLAAGLQAAAEVPSMIATSRFAHRVRPAHVFAAGAAFSLVVYAVWAVVSDPLVLAVTRTIAGLGFGLTSVGAVVIADELVPERLRATGQAASKAVSSGLAPVAGSLGGGIVFGTLGPASFFVIAIVLTAAAAVVAWAAETAQLAAAAAVEQA